jgi:hypothetical protein
MNDVSMLLPLPTEPAAPVLAEITTLVPPALVDRLVFSNNIAPKNGDALAYGDFHVVAVRFDLCSKSSTQTCTTDDGGQVRLILQPVARIGGEVRTHDIALHAFYPIDPRDVPGVVDELREIAQLRTAPSQLAVVGSTDYIAALRTLVLTYARANRLAKLTVAGQDALSAAFAWNLAGVLVDADGGVAPIAIPGLGEKLKQHLLVAGGDAVFDAEPAIDVPVGFAITLNGFAFAEASPSSQRFALETLAAIQNPAKHDANDLMCITCHVATYLTPQRARAAGIDPDVLDERYVTSYDTRVDTVANSDPRVIRAFGWVGAMPAISQRVANDTARVLEDIEARFPTR